jgi:hypothetical protein
MEMTKRLRVIPLAAALVFPLVACDERASETVTMPTDLGTITGHVTLDGTGLAGARVISSSGQAATTGATGQYTLSDVPAGAHTVSLSNLPADASFPMLTATAVIATAGQVVTVNFAGSRLRTSSIVGTVTGAGGVALSNVTVTLSGPESRTTTTSAAGQFSFTGLLAGAYTVAATNPGQACSTGSPSVTVAPGEARVVNFSCTAGGPGPGL